MRNHTNTKNVKSLQKFSSGDLGGMTVFSLFGFAISCMFAGLAIDVTNLHRQKEWITLAADAAAQAGVVALAQKKTTSEIQAAALTAAEANASAASSA